MEVPDSGEADSSGSAADLAGFAPRLADVDRRVRQATAAAIDAVAARDPGGYAAIERAIATNQSARLLYLRTLGEYGPPASLGYLQGKPTIKVP